MLVRQIVGRSLKFKILLCRLCYSFTYSKNLLDFRRIFTTVCFFKNCSYCLKAMGNSCLLEKALNVFFPVS